MRNHQGLELYPHWGLPSFTLGCPVCHIGIELNPHEEHFKEDLKTYMERHKDHITAPRADHSLLTPAAVTNYDPKQPLNPRKPKSFT